MPLVEVPLATAQDVERLYEQPVAEADRPRLERFVEVACARLVRRRPSVRADVAAGLVDAELVRDAVVQAVLRVVRNPAGYASESVGDLSYRLSSAAASGALTFTAEELADCTPLTRGVPAGVGSVRLAPPAYGFPGGDPWR